MGLEIALAIFVGGIGLFSIIYSSLFLRKKDKNRITISSRDGRRLSLPSDISSEDIEKLSKIMRENKDFMDKFESNTIKGYDDKKKDMEIIDDYYTKEKEKEKENGYVVRDFLIYVIPGIIAVLFSGTYVYLIISNQHVQNYKAPEELADTLKAILGYFAGLTASSVSSKDDVLSKEDVRKIIEQNL